jgi:hypothetical protein
VVGDRDEDFALSVFFAETRERAWFAAHLFEFVDHGGGQTMGLVGGPSFTRGADGEWDEDRNLVSRFAGRTSRRRWLVLPLFRD